MKQAIMDSPGEIRFNEIHEPSELKTDEILLKIQKIGICGSDIHVYHGKHPFTPYPVVQGHEYSAIVQSVGKNVKKAKLGMKATARPQLVCGVCGPCKRGNYNVCQNLKVQGFQAPGCAQDFFVVTEDQIILLPENISFEQGALVEPASVGAHSTRRVSDIKGKNAVITGAGTIGNFIAQFVKARGAKKVLITDLSDYRLEIARQCGIENTANMKEETFENAVKRIFGNEGFQVGFEAVGTQATMDGLINNIENGSEIVVAGVFEQPPRINIAFVVEHELKIIGTMMYKHEDYEEAVKYISEGKIFTAPVITKHFPFKQYLDAYKFIDEQGDKTLKVLIDMQ